LASEQTPEGERALLKNLGVRGKATIWTGFETWKYRQGLVRSIRNRFMEEFQRTSKILEVLIVRSNVEYWLIQETLEDCQICRFCFRG